MRNFQFPLHISELRAVREKAKSEAPTATAIQTSTKSLRQTLELNLDDEAERTTDIPALTSMLTPFDIELALQQTLLSLCQYDRPTYVVIAATNPKDVLFLTSELRKYCPRVIPATLNGDLLFAHPDVDAAMSGTLVVSTYPLTQKDRRSRRRGPQNAFPSYVSEGVYNAAAVHLNEMFPNARVYLSGYEGMDTPDKNVKTFAPRRWLTMIFGGKPQPIASGFTFDPAVYRFDRKSGKRVSHPWNRQRPSAKVDFIAIAFLIAAAFHLCFVLGFKYGRWSWFGRLLRSFTPLNLLRPLFFSGDGPDVTQADRAWYRTATLAAFACLAVVALPAARHVIVLNNLPDILLTIFAAIVAAFLVFALSGALTRSVYLSWILMTKRPIRLLPTAISAVRIAGTVLLTTLTVSLFLNWTVLKGDDGDASSVVRLFVQRALESGGMSPLSPLFCLAVVMPANVYPELGGFLFSCLDPIGRLPQ